VSFESLRSGASLSTSRSADGPRTWAAFADVGRNLGWLERVDFTSNDPRNCNPLNHEPPGNVYGPGIQWCIDHGMEGTRIRIHGDDGTFTMYVHLSRLRAGITASTSTRVQPGQLIGWSGNSGISTGAHLHFSRINSAGTATIDPGILHACWHGVLHDYSNLKALRGTTVRNDGYGC
jgi:hypothetical protein